MKTLIVAALILMGSTFVQAGSETFYFFYDTQGFDELAIANAEMYYDGVFICGNNAPVINPDNTLTFACGEHDFTPGEHTYQLVLTAANGEVGRTKVVMAKIPPPPVIVPPMLDPVFLKLEIRRDDDGDGVEEIILTVEG